MIPLEIRELRPSSCRGASAALSAGAAVMAGAL